MSPSRTVQVDEQLEGFETEVSAPFLPGEAAAWCRRVKEQLATLKRTLDSVDESRRRDISQISREDPELLTRTAALRRRRAELEEELAQLRESLAVFQRQIAGGSTDVSPRSHLRRLRADLLDWIVHWRAHDSEIRTWLQEALYRDRGVVD